MSHVLMSAFPDALILLVSLFLAPAASSSLPSLITYQFTKGTEKVFVGSEATECDHSSGTNLPEEAILSDIALLSSFYQNACYTNKQYSHQDWKVENGTLTSSDGRSFVAYKFYPYAVKATNFHAGCKEIYVRSSKAGDLKIYSFDGTGFSKVTNSKAASGQITVTQGVFTATGICVNALTDPLIYMFDPDGVRLSAWPLLPGSSGLVEGATVASATGFSLSARRFSVSGRPFVPESDWNASPESWQHRYGIPKKFFIVGRSDGKEGVVWQDQDTSDIYMTWFASDLLSSDTTKISSGPYHLLAAASDGQNSIVLIKLSTNPPADKKAGLDANAIKIHSTTGAEALSKALDTSKGTMNIHKHSSSGASMVWDTVNKKIGLVTARTMTQAGDGLNHQGAAAYIFDAETLDLASTAYGQTSSHSFANSMVLVNNTFIGMDLGDNYPRGIHIWGFKPDGDKLGDQLIYAFKTKHGTSATSPAGQSYEAYTEISGGGTTYYKWSNDNNVYTEIAHDGLVVLDDSILVFFAGERPPLDNSLVGANMNVPRNLGFVKIGRDLSTKEILSSGETSTGGFYTFGGGWSAQENKGINFLTSYTSTDECVSRPKTARISNGKTLLVWELWTKSAYVKSQAMVVDDAGSAIQQVFDIGYPLQLPFADNMLIIGGKAVAYAGTTEGQIIRYEICTGSQCAVTSPNSGGGGAGGGIDPTASKTVHQNSMSVLLGMLAMAWFLLN